MTKDGTMTIDTTDKLAVNTTNNVAISTSDVNITGKSSITLNAPTVSITGGSLNMTGGSGECVIGNVSLLKHIHPVPPHCPGPGTT